MSGQPAVANIGDDVVIDFGGKKDGVAFERERNTAPAGFPALPDIPGGRSWDPDFFALERESLFKQSWLYAGHTDQLSDPGSFIRISAKFCRKSDPSGEGFVALEQIGFGTESPHVAGASCL